VAGDGGGCGRRAPVVGPAGGDREAKRLCPELLRAELVRVGDGTWLDVLTWSVADGEERLMARSGEFDSLIRMHGFLENAEPVGRGEVVASA
jgi:hypothetical protein